ncbi:integrase [Neorhizobium galegae]|uniref:Integrase n=1 Tax=Neorhizobium galegae TaxID=399 RepID=A0A6A1TU47_NEOGA|nr:integrase [Neorhizobium galegae]
MLVTGIQQHRVCGVQESFQPTDLGWLDSCDKHRNEEGLELPPRQVTGAFDRLTP